MMKRRFLIVAAVFAVILGIAGQGAAFAQGTTATGKFTAGQYKKALWMVTRMYGGQRSGVGPNWLIMEHTNPAYRTSFTHDADGGHNLEGGWFDCGDHVTFGHTFFFSAYMLAKAYEAFPIGFHDLYHGKDYSDYAASGDWSIAGGQPNGIPDLLEELKYATDWIIKAAPDASTFYYEKGDGGKDHNTWVTAGKMSTQEVKDGGEPRTMWKNPNDGVMASFAAGTLAIMSKIYRKYDAAYADSCLKYAKNAYAYAKSHKNNSAGAASGSFYSAHKDPATVFTLAASEMYMATGESAYKSDIVKNDVKTHWHVLDYSNSHDLAAYAAADAVPEDRDAHLQLALTEFVNKYTGSGSINGEKVTTRGGDWGQMRYAGNTAFSVALYSKAKDISSHDQFIYDQVDYILGGNNSKQSFVVGFCEGCTKVASKPHHRNVFLDDRNVPDNQKNQLVIPEKNKYFGYLVGGNRNSGSYVDDVNDYRNTEGGIDYSAGLLGALAYIVSKESPADTSKFGKPVIIPAPAQTIRMSLSANPADTASFLKDSVSVNDLYSGNAGKQLFAHIFDDEGAVISNPICGNITWEIVSSGVMPTVPGTLKSAQAKALTDTGCVLTVPFAADAVVTSVKATYSFIGFDRPSISVSVRVYNPTISVLPRNMSLAKHGYAMIVKPNAVTFTAAEGIAITKLGIYNIQGKRVFNSAGASPSITWNRTNRPRGMYLIKLSLSNGSMIQRNLMLK
jgi:hypothetical protein